MSKKKKQLWERQTWDTKASFHNFHTYYLPQSQPRSLNKAYRNAQKEKGKNPDRKLEASGSWRLWYQGRDYKGKKINGSIGWDERANAYDDYLAYLTRDEWEKRKEKVRQADWDAGERLRKIANKAMEDSPDMDMKEATKAVETASKLQRLAAGMETDRIIDDSEKSFHITIEKNETEG